MEIHKNYEFGHFCSCKFNKVKLLHYQTAKIAFNFIFTTYLEIVQYYELQSLNYETGETGVLWNIWLCSIFSIFLLAKMLQSCLWVRKALENILKVKTKVIS